MHHLAFTDSDIQQRIDQVKAAGLEVIDQTPRTGAHAHRIAFIHPKGTFGVLTEICEPSLAQTSFSPSRPR
jgi:methylmalonyl-CoA epimerase